ncbi:hypothetical protein [Pseudomonas turukhanskensis]|uniref:Uncharacterized protein n=1 Tax=Pseudomonas turukhanskensis TaxID=1806536 RepID=A0A9W6K5C6_9PSED|nr:hypothetical protein [Pseudomonas turukhanskensis]GLK88551.1 hypothetical protein GCM10017655_16130 [Pseudomonas turukhanskensis]
MKTRLPWLALLLIAGLGASTLCVAQSLAPENHRVSVRVLDPAAPPLSQWRVKVYVSYRPLVEGSPNTTETTTSRANCATPSRFGSIVPSFKTCTVTRNREVQRMLPAAQMKAAGPNTLNLDVAPVIEDHGGTFAIADLVLAYMTCAKGCEDQRMDIRLSCYADDVDHGEVLADGVVLSYSRGAKAHPGVADCGLRLGDETTWSNRDTVIARIRGHFADEQQMVSHDLLSTFPAIPTPDNRWVWNAARGNNDLSDYCAIPEQQSYVNSTYYATLPPAVGWPYQHKTEVYVTSKPSGEVCTIWLTGTGDESYMRYFYNFADGQLVKAYTMDEPDDVSREWRWVNGEPWEFTRRQVPDSIAGHDAILYWHKTAAQLWPKRMDYQPNLKEFAALRAFAQQLYVRFPAKENAGEGPQ